MDQMGMDVGKHSRHLFGVVSRTSCDPLFNVIYCLDDNRCLYKSIFSMEALRTAKTGHFDAQRDGGLGIDSHLHYLLRCLQLFYLSLMLSRKGRKDDRRKENTVFQYNFMQSGDVVDWVRSYPGIFDSP